jgi:integrase
VASLRKRGDKWYAEVTKNGQRKSKTFATKAEATLWAAQTEVALAKEGAEQIPDKTFADLLDKYEREVSPTHRGHRWEALRLRKIARQPIGGIKLKDFSEVHVYQWRDARLTEVSSSSVSREFELLSSVCSTASREWKWLGSNPFKNVKKPRPAQPRSKVYSDDEIERILFALGYNEIDAIDTQTKRVGAVFLFALETAMRAGEIVGLTWGNVFDKHVFLPMTKNGTSREVPLSKRAREIIARLPRDGDSVFGLSSAMLISVQK